VALPDLSAQLRDSSEVQLGGKTDEKWLEIPIGDDALVFNTSESPATWAQLPIPIPIDDEG
jgi:hypothetical protein